MIPGIVAGAAVAPPALVPGEFTMLTAPVAYYDAKAYSPGYFVATGELVPLDVLPLYTVDFLGDLGGGTGYLPGAPDTGFMLQLVPADPEDPPAAPAFDDLFDSITVNGSTFDAVDATFDNSSWPGYARWVWPTEAGLAIDTSYPGSFALP